jgi:hypothetical protein
VKKIFLLILFFFLFFIYNKAYAFNFHQYISIKNINSIKADKNINISDFRALLRNWYNLAAGSNSFLLPKGHYLYPRTRHRKTLALLTYYILRYYQNIANNINRAGKHNETALYIAQKRGQYKVISVLLSTKIKPLKANLITVHYNKQPILFWSTKYLLSKFVSHTIQEKYKNQFGCYYKKYISYAYNTNKFTGVKTKVVSSSKTKKICRFIK